VARGGRTVSGSAKRRRRRSWREVERYLLGRDEPAEKIATGIGLGVAIGMTPLLGLQSLVAIGLAFALRLPRLDVWLATYVMNPWTILPILGFEHWLGRRILSLPPGGGAVGWSQLLRGSLVGAFRSFGPKDLYALALGSSLVCLASGLAAYLATRALVLQLRARRAPASVHMVGGTDD